MAITFPRDLPSGIPFYVTYFDIQTMGEDSVTQGGTPLVVENGPALYKVSFATPPLLGSEAQRLKAWLHTIKSPPNPFWAPDLRRRYPAAYQGGFPALVRATGGDFDGTCALASVADDAVTVGLEHLPQAFALGAGDYVAFDYNSGASRALHTVVSDPAQADAEGNLTVEVRPPVRAGYSAGATVYLDGPKAKFNLVRGSDKPKTDNTNKTIFTFDGMQTLA